MTIRIIRTSERGAHLITNEQVVCWVQGRCVRPDMSLTRMGEAALAAATQTLEEWEEESRQREEAKQQRREAAREASRELVYVTIAKESMYDSTDRAWKVWFGGYTRLYGKVVKSYTYLPKSQVTISREEGENIVLEMPRWLARQYSWEQ